MYFDDSDKTVADFDIEAFNRQYEAKKKAEDSEDEVEEESFEDDFDEFEDDLFKDDDLEQELNDSIDSSSPSKPSEEKPSEKPEPEQKSRKGRKREQAPAEKTEIFDLKNFDMGGDAPAPSEKTEIFDLNQFNMGEEEEEEEEIDYARIKIIDGADPVEYTLATDRFTVGRSDENDITISNGTISRTHCEFVYSEEEGFSVSDLNSGNGIKVNGKKTTSKKLKSGDKVSIGGIKVQFFDLISSEDDYQESRSNRSSGGSNKPKNKKLILIVAVGVLLLATISGIVISKNNAEKRRQDQIAQQQQIKERQNAQTLLFFDKGIQAYKNKEWNAAIEHFNSALEIRPDYTDAQTNKALALKEQEHEKLIIDSKNNLLDKDYQGALLKLKKVPDTSLYYGDAQKDLKRAKDLYQTARMEEAQKEFEAKAFTKAKTIVDAIIMDNPTHEAALALQKQVDEGILKEKCPKGVDEEGNCIQGKCRYGKDRSGKCKVPAPCRSGWRHNSRGVCYKPRKRQPTDPAFRAIAGYGSENFDVAINKLQALVKLKQSEKAPVYLGQMKQLKLQYTRGMRAAKQRNVTPGIKMLRNAKATDAQLGGKLKRKIHKALANLHGIRAEKYFAQKVYESAYSNVAQARKYDSSEPLSKKVLSSLKKIALQLYLKAYMKEARDPEAAKKTYKRILKMVPRSSTPYQKAKGRL